jgi:hypothetical protein
MAKADEMRALIERVEQAQGWDSRIDEDIARALGWDQDENDEWHQVGVFFPDGLLRRTSYAVELPPWTRSLDAAVSLVPEGLFPRIYFEMVQAILVTRGEADGFVWVEVTRSGICHTPALALVAAALRARLAMEEGA